MIDGLKRNLSGGIFCLVGGDVAGIGYQSALSKKLFAFAGKFTIAL